MEIGAGNCHIFDTVCIELLESPFSSFGGKCWLCSATNHFVKQMQSAQFKTKED